METLVHAIVLRRRDSGESDRRLTLLTEELGKVDAIAKGARKAASRLAGSSDPLTVATMNLAIGKANRFLTQVQPEASFRGIRGDFDRLSYGLSLSELFDSVTPYEEPVPEAYELLLKVLAQLDSHGRPLVVLAWSQIKLLEVSGFLPQFGRCVVTGGPISEAMPYLSPQAGGYVSDSVAETFIDRFRVRAEVLYGLSRLAEWSTAPQNLKFAKECVIALAPFWHHITDAALPANRAMIGELRASFTEQPEQ